MDFSILSMSRSMAALRVSLFLSCMTSKDIPVSDPASPSPKSTARVRAITGSLLLRGLAEPNLLSISSTSLGISWMSMQKPSFEELRIWEWMQGARPLEQAHHAFSGGSR